MSHLKNAHTSQTLPVHRSRDFVVTNGVAEGDPISFADELLMDDIYQITEAAQRLPLSVAMDPDTGALTVAMQSAIGTAGNAIYLDSCLTFMMSDSTTCAVSYTHLDVYKRQDGNRSESDTFSSTASAGLIAVERSFSIISRGIRWRRFDVA